MASIKQLSAKVVRCAVLEVASRKVTWQATCEFVAAKPDDESVAACLQLADDRGVKSTVSPYIRCAQKLSAKRLASGVSGKLSYFTASNLVRESDDGESNAGRPLSKEGFATALTQTCKGLRQGLATKADRARLVKALAAKK